MNLFGEAGRGDHVSQIRYRKTKLKEVALPKRSKASEYDDVATMGGLEFISQLEIWAGQRVAVRDVKFRSMHALPSPQECHHRG